MDLDQFRARFPEFAQATPGYIASCLEAAALELDSDGLGTLYGEFHGLLAAHKLASSPFGVNARMQVTLTMASGATSVTTQYALQFNELVRRTQIGVSVIG